MAPTKPAWSVRHATLNEDYTIELGFSDGSRRIYDANPLLDEPLFAPLRNPAFFAGGRAEFGTVIWSDEADIPAGSPGLRPPARGGLSGLSSCTLGRLCARPLSFCAPNGSAR